MCPDNFHEISLDQVSPTPSLRKDEQHWEPTCAVQAGQPDGAPSNIPEGDLLPILEKCTDTLFNEMGALKKNLKECFVEGVQEAELAEKARQIFAQWNPYVNKGCKIANIAVLASGLTFNAIKDVLVHGDFICFTKEYFPQYSKSTIKNYRDYAKIPRIEKYLHIPYTQALILHGIAQGITTASEDPISALLNFLGFTDAAELPKDKEEIQQLFWYAEFSQKVKENGIPLSRDKVERLVNAGHATEGTLKKLIRAKDDGEDVEGVAASILKMGTSTQSSNRKIRGKAPSTLTVETAISRLKKLLDDENEHNTFSYRDAKEFKSFLDAANVYYEKMKSSLTPQSEGGE